MKKILSSLLVLAMILTMLPTAFAAADYTINLGAESYTATPGSTIDIPVNIAMTSGADAVTGITQVEIFLPEGFSATVEEGALKSSDFSVIGNKVTLYNDAGATYKANTAAVTMKVTVPETTGEYTFTYGETILCDAAFDEITSIDVVSTKVIVAEEQTDEPGGDTPADEPIVSDKDYVINFGKKNFNVEPGASFDMPLYIESTKEDKAVTGITQVEIFLPEGFTATVEAGTLSSSDFSLIGNKVTVYNDAGATYINDTAVVTLKVTAPATAGTYNITYGETILCDAAFDEITSLDVIATSITVGGTVVPPVVNKYTVTYKVNGEVVKTFEDVEEGTATPAYEYTAEEGYTFSGWGEVPATVTGDLVIEGTTSKKTFTVTYKVDGKDVKVFENVEYGANVPAYEYTAEEGYTFSGWGEVPATVTEALVIEGTTAKKTFTVTYKVDGEVVKTFENVEYGANVPAYNYEVAEGYTFSGWGEVPATVTEDLVIEGTTEEIVTPDPGPGEDEEDEPIVSDKDYVINFGKKNFKVEPGASFDMPLYIESTKEDKAVTGITQVEIFLPEGFTATVEAGTLSSSDFSVIGNKVTVYNDAGATYINDTAVVTLKVTAPATAGTYNITYGETILCDAAFDEITSLDVIATSIVVGGTVEPPVEVNKYTVTYKVNGEVVKTFTDVEEGTATPAYEYTAEEGYTFSGWGEVPATVTEDLVIEGTTTIKTFTVTYKVDGEVVDTFTVNYGDAVPASTYEAPEGYTFSGWGEVPATVTEDLVIEGTTEPIPATKYTVTFKAEDAEDVVIEVEEGAAIGDALATATKEGFVFAGWFTDDGEEITAETVVNANIEATAKFVRIEGDVNCDGAYNSKDAIYLLNYVILPELYDIAEYLEYYDDVDFNGDGKVTSQDAIQLLNNIVVPALYTLK